MTEEQLSNMNLDNQLSHNEMVLKRFFGDSEAMYSTNTYQFDYYSKEGK